MSEEESVITDKEIQDWYEGLSWPSKEAMEIMKNNPKIEEVFRNMEIKYTCSGFDSGYKFGKEEAEEEIATLKEQYSRLEALADHLIKEATKTPEEEEAEEAEFEEWYLLQEIERREKLLKELYVLVENLSKYEAGEALLPLTVEELSRVKNFEELELLLALRDIYKKCSPEERKKHFILGAD